MSDLRAAAQQALEALGLWATGRDMDAVALNDLIFRLEAALAEPVQEPVAFGIEERAGVPVLFSKDGGCRPATAEEWLMWGIISAAINGDKERAHGIEGDA